MGFSWPSRKTKEKKEKGSVWCFNGFKGPLNVVGPLSKCNGSGLGPIMLVSDPGNFRRFGKHINCIKKLNETYIY